MWHIHCDFCKGQKQKGLCSKSLPRAQMTLEPNLLSYLFCTHSGAGIVLCMRAVGKVQWVEIKSELPSIYLSISVLDP